MKIAKEVIVPFKDMFWEVLLEFGSWISNIQWYLGSGSHSEFRSTTKDTNNLELGGIRLIEALLPDGTIVYRESNFGQETEVPIFIGNAVLFPGFSFISKITA